MFENENGCKELFNKRRVADSLFPVAFDGACKGQ